MRKENANTCKPPALIGHFFGIYLKNSWIDVGQWNAPYDSVLVLAKYLKGGSLKHENKDPSYSTRKDQFSYIPGGLHFCIGFWVGLYLSHVFWVCSE